MKEQPPIVLVLATLASLAGAPAWADEDVPGDPVAGQVLAERVCADCHAVQAGDRKGVLPNPPAFQLMADDPAMTPLALRVFLESPHHDMPNLILTEEETDDVIAWIHSLKSGD